MQENYGLDALGKGKGLTKGKSKGWSKGKSDGFRTAPQQQEQTQWSTPTYGKSKGKGKGPVCWHCGIQGHPQRLCPQLDPGLTSDVNQKGKGKGKSGSKGKSKGAYEVNGEDPECNW